MRMNDIELNKVRFAFPSAQMCFDIHIERYALTIVTGPSGSGKSSLLNLIAGFEAPLSGTVKLMGEDVTLCPPSKRPVAMLFQDHNMFSHLTVEANVSLGIRPNLKLIESEKARVGQALARVGLEGKAGRLPSELSGGERQRVAFARTLVQNRQILLLDEPFASLGPRLRYEMTRLLAELQREKNLTVLAVTHHPQEWQDLADSFVFIEDGHITAQGAMKELTSSNKNAAITSYLGS
jgi:thiamine transport system ATP-binding protein